MSQLNRALRAIIPLLIGLGVISESVHGFQYNSQTEEVVSKKTCNKTPRLPTDGYSQNWVVANLQLESYQARLYNYSVCEILCDYRIIAQYDFHPDKLPHIFRDDHNIRDTPENRQLLRDVANDPRNFVKIDKHGNYSYAKTLPDGRQVWVKVRDGTIRNGGINLRPRSFNSL